MNPGRDTTTLGRVACVVPAKDESASIAATVRAAAALPRVEVVLVCDDASSDDTGAVAAAAGAIVVSHDRSRGKAAAVDSAVNALGILEQRDGRRVCGTLLLLDPDLAGDAAACRPLIEPVVRGQADLTIGVPREAQTADASPTVGSGVGTSVVETLARSGIAELTGWSPRAPLSGQRCLTRAAFELASPLAAGWGIEVGMTADILKAGLIVREIDLDTPPRGTPPRGTRADLTEQLHCARQLRDVARALAGRGLVRRRVRVGIARVSGGRGAPTSPYGDR